MKGRERPCSIRRRLRSSLNVLQRSVELATQSGHLLICPIPISKVGPQAGFIGNFDDILPATGRHRKLPFSGKRGAASTWPDQRLAPVGLANFRDILIPVDAL
jgi:hypothetical protein